MGMDLSVKESVVIRAYMGFERIIKKSIEKFEAMGLNVHIFRSPAASINKKSVRFGFLGTSPNPQYEYCLLYTSRVFSSWKLRCRILISFQMPMFLCFA